MAWRPSGDGSHECGQMRNAGHGGNRIGHKDEYLNTRENECERARDNDRRDGALNQRSGDLRDTCRHEQRKKDLRSRSRARAAGFRGTRSPQERRTTARPSSPWRQAARYDSLRHFDREPVETHRRTSVAFGSSVLHQSAPTVTEEQRHSDSGLGSSEEYSTVSDSRASSPNGNGCEADSGCQNVASNNRKGEIIHYTWKNGDILDARYEISRLLGDGTFGRVLLARDLQEDRQVAIKVIRDVKRYMENAKIESEILRDIHNADPDGCSRCAIMFDTFMHEVRHFCLVFEPLGVSLYEFLKKNAFRGFWMQDIQSFARQSLKCLKFLHSTLSLTHTDLKPENILLQSMEPARPSYFPREKEWLERNHRSSKARLSHSYLRPQSNQIKIIDFGNATYEDEHHSSVINTRQYRGPEVVLELGWNERSDLWSLGCIIMELYIGELLFGTHENLEHLALMERVIQPLPPDMLERTSSSVREKYLTQLSGGRMQLHWPERASSKSSVRHVHGQVRLQELTSRSHFALADLVGNMLTHNPALRPSASELLRDKFFQAAYDD